MSRPHEQQDEPVTGAGHLTVAHLLPLESARNRLGCRHLRRGEGRPVT